jgi:uncharacterized Zn-finger protein
VSIFVTVDHFDMALDGIIETTAKKKSKSKHDTAVYNDIQSTEYMNSIHGSNFGLDLTSYMTKSYHCQYCGKFWRTPSLLQRHILTHTGERPYSCKDCGQTFKQKAHLDSHTVRVHKT